MICLLVKNLVKKGRVRHFTDFASSYISKIQGIKVDKTQIAEFYKTVHPDLMANAPVIYKEQNSKSMQELNSYIQSIEKNTGANYVKLDFFANFVNKKKKVIEKQSEEFRKFAVELLPLKANSSDELRKMHIKQQFTYNSSIHSVLQTLKESIQKLQDDPKGKAGELLTKMRAKYDSQKEPKKEKQIYVIHHLKILQKELDKLQETELLKSLIKANPIQKSRKKVLNHIYRNLYNIDLPSKLTRQPDPMFKFLVDSTEDISNINAHFASSIDPSFIYFDNSLNDIERNKCIINIYICKKYYIVIKRLQGLHIAEKERTEKVIKLKRFSQELYENNPTIYILVCKEYSTNIIEGFLGVPFKFEIDELISFYNEKRSVVLEKAAKLIEKSSEAMILQDELKAKYYVQIADKNPKDEWFDYTIALKHIKKLISKDKNLNTKMMKYAKICIGNEYKHIEKGVIEIPAYFKDEKLNELI